MNDSRLSLEGIPLNVEHIPISRGSKSTLGRIDSFQFTRLQFTAKPREFAVYS